MRFRNQGVVHTQSFPKLQFFFTLCVPSCQISELTRKTSDTAVTRAKCFFVGMSSRIQGNSWVVHTYKVGFCVCKLECIDEDARIEREHLSAKKKLPINKLVRRIIADYNTTCYHPCHANNVVGPILLPPTGARVALTVLLTLPNPDRLRWGIGTLLGRSISTGALR